MSETTQLTIGAKATCSDGVCGEVDRLAVDPAAKVVTYVVVEPKDRGAVGRLVPIQLVDAPSGEIRLACTLAEFENLGAAEEVRPQPPLPSQPWEQQLLGGQPDPQYEGMRDSFGFAVPKPPEPITYDLVPTGTVEVHRGSQVVAKDGDIGQLQALVIDSGNHNVTHLVLQAGHLWGRKQVAIPISAVNFFEDEGMAIQLKISKREVHGLPELDIEQPTG